MEDFAGRAATHQGFVSEGGPPRQGGYPSKGSGVMKKQSTFATLAVLVFVGATETACGQGTVADGDLTWAYTSVTGTAATGANANFLPTGAGASDHVYQQWWWYRIGSTGPETALPTPTMQSYMGNTATLDHTTASFTSQLTVTLADGVASAAGSAVQAMTVTNVTAAPIDLHLFCYIDFDVLGSAGDSAAFVAGDTDHIRVTDATGAYSDFLGVDADAYQVTTFAGLRTQLNDAATTNLANTGVPFPAADFTGGFQWNRTVAAGESVTVHVVITCNETAVPPVVMPPDPEFRRGDCNSDGSRNLVDAVFLLSWLFPQGGPPPTLACVDSCDASDDGGLNLVDVIALLNALFGQPPIPLAGPDLCGPDPTLDAATCDAYTACP